MSRHEILQHPSVELPDPLAPAVRPSASPAAQARPEPAGLQRSRPHHTWQQVVGGLLIAAACVVAATWYVPRVLRTDRRLLTGSVVTSGVSTLNFTSSGDIARVAVYQGEHVHKGQLLATEYAPDTAAVLTADITAIRSEDSKLAAMQAAAHSPPSSPHGPPAPTAADISAVQAQLKLDEAQLAADRARGAASRIVAPAAGAVVAANGRPGEAVSSQGIRDYVAVGPRSQVDQTPAFSLLPEGPQTDRRAVQTSSALPVVALRTSSAWQVAALVPQGTVSRIHVNDRVSITVPAAHITRIPGWISEVLTTPVMTAQGDEYQAVVRVSGHVDTPPLSGMAADVRLDPTTTIDHRR